MDVEFSVTVRRTKGTAPLISLTAELYPQRCVTLLEDEG